MGDDLKARLLAPRLPEDEVPIPGIGTVRVRGLNRHEAMSTQGLKGTEAIERRMMALGLLDPPMTEAEVGQWQRAAPAGELEPVTSKIAELSGMTSASTKEAYKSLSGESGAGVRVLPGGEADDDGGRATGADER